MCTTRCLASLLVSITALVMVGCSADEAAGPFCDMPAALNGQYDPTTPGYIVIFQPGVDVTEEVERLSAEYPMEVRSVYEMVLEGFFATMSDGTLQQLRCEPSIQYIQRNAGTWGNQATPDQAPSR